MCEGADGEETPRTGSEAEEDGRDGAEESRDDAAAKRGTEKVDHHLVTNNNTNTNTNDNVYGAVIMARPLREFTRFI